MENRFVDIHTHRTTGDVLTPLSYGIHPWDAATGRFDPAQAAAAEVIGEIGLDFACKVDRAVQERCFTAQLAAAERLAKPVVLHCVRAFEPTMLLLARYRLRAVIFHGFTGSPQQAARAAAAGCYLSFGLRTPRSPRTVEALAATPPDRLFLETDTAAVPVAEVYAMAAAVRGCTVEALRLQLLHNYQTLFSIR